jgi:hypothetical protein
LPLECIQKRCPWEAVPVKIFSKDMKYNQLHHQERVYDSLPFDRPSCVISENVILCSERWILYPRERVYQEVKAYFTVHCDKSKAGVVTGELRMWLTQFLAQDIDHLFELRPGTTAFCDFCEKLDDRLAEMLRKKLLILHGSRQAEAFAHETKLFNRHAPDLARALHAVMSRDFRSPAQQGASGDSGESTKHATEGKRH